MLLSPTGRHRPLRPNEKAPVRINVVLLEFFGAYLQEARLQNLDKAQNLKNDIYIYICSACSNVPRTGICNAKRNAFQKNGVEPGASLVDHKTGSVRCSRQHIVKLQDGNNWEPIDMFGGLCLHRLVSTLSLGGLHILKENLIVQKASFGASDRLTDTSVKAETKHVLGDRLEFVHLCYLQPPPVRKR